MVGRLIGVVGRLENDTGCGGLRLPPFLVGSGKKFLEACPGLDVRWLASPELAVAVEEPGLEHELKGNFDNLGRGVGRVSGGGVVNRIFDLINQGFERLISFLGRSESLVIFLQSGGENVSVCSVDMIQ